VANPTWCRCAEAFCRRAETGLGPKATGPGRNRPNPVTTETEFSAIAGNIPAGTAAMRGALTVPKKQGEKAEGDLSDPPEWRPSGKSEWMLQLMLKALHEG
jgi:hypothetical protein